METKWHVYILWSVLSLDLLSPPANTRQPSYVLRRKEVSTSGSQKSKHDAVKSSPSGDSTSSPRSAVGSAPLFPPEPRPPTEHYDRPQKSDTDTHVPDVSVTCAASDVVVRVKRAFYGLGARAGELKLGNTCTSNGLQETNGDLLFTYPLTACNVQRELLLDYLVYKFVLHYQPSPTRSGAHKISVRIECRYQRNHHVRQLALQPTWKTAAVHKRLRGRMNDVHMELMDDSWRGPVQSQVFQLGQTVNVQLSAPHLPAGRRLYVHSCYAYPSGGSGPGLQSALIDNSGCLLDSKTDPGASEFISRTDKSLRFSLKAFQFTSTPASEIRIKCKLLSTSADPGPAHKSCTYRHDRWEALSGDDSICDCCDSWCVASKHRRAMMEGSAGGSLLVSSQLHTDDHLQPIRSSMVRTRDMDVTRDAHDAERHSPDGQWPSRTEDDRSGAAQFQLERFDFGVGIIVEESKELDVKDPEEFGEDGSWYEEDKEAEQCNRREDEPSHLEPMHRNAEGKQVQFKPKPEEEGAALRAGREEENSENKGREVVEVQGDGGDGQEVTWYFTWGL